EDDTSIGALVLTGKGDKSFIAGDDIAEFETRKKDDFRILQNLTIKIEEYKKPIIASINGYALGGGCEIAISCDFRIASENAKFGFPEIKLGLIPGAGGTQRLPKLIGLSKAKQLIFTGELIDSKEALRIGLIDIITKQSELRKYSLEFAHKLSKFSPLALQLAKKAINSSSYVNLKNGLDMELDYVWDLKNSEISKKLVRDFLNRK
ncbi:MAG: enoyl-CoA hydratase/isomerase family protein, partial [Candidatus Helarchaeota archaeon]